MTIDFSQPIRNLDGSVVKDRNRTENGEIEETPLLLSNVCIAALGNPPDKLKQEDQIRHWKLANKLHGAAHVDLKVDDVALLKKLVGQRYAQMPFVSAQAQLMLDPEPVEVPAENGLAEHV